MAKSKQSKSTNSAKSPQKIRIKALKRLASARGGIAAAGHIVDWPADEAKALIADGAAEAVKTDNREQPEPATTEQREQPEA